MAPVKAAELVIESGPGQLAGLHWDQLQLEFRGASPDPDWRIAINGLNLDGAMELGRIELTCRRASRPVSDGCADGHVDWQLEESDLALSASFVHRREAGVHRLVIEDEHWRMDVSVPDDEPARFSARIALSDLDLSELPAMVADQLGLSLLYGQVNGQIMVEPERMTADLELTGAGFDDQEGFLAGDGLELDIRFESAINPLAGSFTLTLAQSAGELLMGSLYLPPPAEPMTLELTGRLDDEIIHLDRFALLDADALELEGMTRLIREADGWQSERVRIESAHVHFPLGWERWVDGHAAAAGFADIKAQGRVEASVDWQTGRPADLQTEWFDVTIEDPGERLVVAGIDGTLTWGRFGPDSDLSWKSLMLYGLPFGPSSLALRAEAIGVGLDRPLRLPLLDGAIVIDQVVWAPGDEQAPGFGFDARIEPLDLAELTRALEWPEFGGVLSGEFPGVMLIDDVLKVTGGIDIQAFSGQIQLTELAVERPFGTLPALSAQVEFSRLDLLELTGAFNFGRMEGQLSGWMRDLRLLDWRPVAMDTRVFTHEDAPRRRISQRAVENLSDLGGGGGALLSGTVLRVFEDFPYRRAGLACRLSNNICHIDGVARHESGGFYIVEGRALPRLDIVGHRRLVDWPQLMGQLVTMLE